MTWVKATERLPEVLLGTSEPFFVRDLRWNIKKVLWYGKGTGLLLKRPYDFEWLDETEPQQQSKNIYP